MKLEIVLHKKYRKDLKIILKRGYEMSLLVEVLDLLQNGIPLPPKYKDHPLIGEYKDFRDCHIEPDWILIYRTDEQFLYLARTGTHSDLF